MDEILSEDYSSETPLLISKSTVALVEQNGTHLCARSTSFNILNFIIT